MRLYFDTAYLAKCYWNEPDGRAVRAMARNADEICSSAVCIAEIACLAHRKVREAGVTASDASRRRELFLDDLKTGVISVIPVTERILLRVESVTRSLPDSCYLRSLDALHLVTAAESGFGEVWTNDRHMLAAAPFFGLTGRSV